MKSGFCVLWGRPNVGKSTLLNALLGRKHVIVSPRPQTTRNRIAGVLNSTADERWQVVFLDTPGIHQPRHKLGEALVKSATHALQDVECVVLVVDAREPPHDDDLKAVQMLQGHPAPVLLALNKVDALPWSAGVSPAQRAQQYGTLREFAGELLISALHGTGLEELKASVVQAMPEGQPYFPAGVLGDRPPEFHLAEIVREQALLQLQQEVPHAIAVQVERMEPRPQRLLYVEAVILLERDSQKGIVIGAGGARLKEIGHQARLEMQRRLRRRVFLDLRVKVRRHWRESELWVQRLGFEE